VPALVLGSSQGPLIQTAERVIAGTDGGGVFAGNQNCEGWAPLGERMPSSVFSVATDDKYLYAGTDDGVYRFPIDAIPGGG
jgi:hypothetical protein